MIRSTNYRDRLSNRSMSYGWQFGSGFRELHLEFPGFVEENDSGGSTAMRIGCGLCARRFD